MPTDAELEAQAEALRSRNPQSSLHRLVDAIISRVEISVSPTGRAYASTDPEHRDRVCALDGPECKSFVMAVAYANKIAFSPNSFPQVVAVLEYQSRARPTKNVYHRIGHLGDKIYFDRGTRSRSIVEISPVGAKIIETAPILFARTPGMLELPEPDLDGALDEIDALVLQLDERNLKLLKGAIVAAAHRTGPYFITLIIGPHGGGKTNIGRLIRMLIDPNADPLRSAPRKSDDLFAIVSNEYMAGFDNVSHLPRWLADEFCQIATGGATTNRRFFCNRGAVTLSAKGPIVITSIPLPTHQPDFLNRSIVIHVPMMPDNLRQSEEEWAREFRKAYPRIFGGLCNALSMSLRNIDKTTVPGSIRMIDAARSVAAAEHAIGCSPGEFAKLYIENQRDLMYGVLEDDIFGNAVVEFARKEGSFSGNATTLDQKLAAYRPVGRGNGSEWPKLKQIRGRLEELEPLLRSRGVMVDTKARGGANNQHLIVITFVQRPPLVRVKLPQHATTSITKQAPGLPWLRKGGVRK